MHIPFIFSTDFSQLLRPDLLGWCLHLVCLDGSGGFIYNGSLYAIKKNDIVIAPHPELITQADAGDGLEVMFVYGDLKFINSQMPANHYGIKGGINLRSNPVIHGTDEEVDFLRMDMLNIQKRLSHTDDFYFKESLGAAAQQLVFDLFEPHKRRDGLQDFPQGAAAVVKRLTQILESGSTMTHREVSWYADELNVSPKYLSETVRRLTGDNVVYLINRYAGPIITRLLRDNTLSITQIAYRMEFSSVSYFSRYTKRVLGVSPQEFRRKM